VDSNSARQVTATSAYVWSASTPTRSKSKSRSRSTVEVHTHSVEVHSQGPQSKSTVKVEVEVEVHSQGQGRQSRSRSTVEVHTHSVEVKVEVKVKVDSQGQGRGRRPPNQFPITFRGHLEAILVLARFSRIFTGLPGLKVALPLYARPSWLYSKSISFSGGTARIFDPPLTIQDLKIDTRLRRFALAKRQQKRSLDGAGFVVNRIKRESLSEPSARK